VNARHPSRHGQRPSRSARSRSTNLADFDPFETELRTVLPSRRPAATIDVGGAMCSVYEKTVHGRFIRPFDAHDVRALLATVPPAFLRDLESIYLLGGTRRQEQVSRGRLFRFGAYGDGIIVLNAFPRALLREPYRHLPAPHVVNDYRRAGAELVPVRRGWELRFSAESLRRFYLSDVLVHEIGHHVDRHHPNRSTRRMERYAEWFASAHGRRFRSRRPT